MPVHLLLLGPASAGKSYTLTIVLRLLPPQAYHSIDAGSPRVLIYDTTELKHKVIVFGEADSLPAGEDNPAASAVRALLQDHRLHYQTVVKGEDGRQTVQSIEREGPSVLLTTSTRRLGDQLRSRMFELEVADDLPQLRASLETQAAIEVSGAREPDEALIAFQGYLQTKAPFDVLVPYAPQLAEAIAKSAAAPRINRDFARLLSLVKSVAVLRHAKRQVEDGRIVAELEDYASVYDLVGELYEGSVGASRLVREAVGAVAALLNLGEKSVSAARVAARLGISKMAASRRLRTAISEGWLVNTQSLKGRPWVLVLGDPLPSKSGLPEPSTLAPTECNGVTRQTAGSSTHTCDPRADDLTEDSRLWEQLLLSAWQAEKDGEAHPLWEALHGLRCLGARLEPANGEGVILHGRQVEDYEQIKTEWLKPLHGQVVTLLKEVKV